MTEQKSPTRLSYSYRGELIGPDGVLKQVVEKKNIVVDDGLDEILNLMSGLSANHFGYIAMGTGGAAHTYASAALNTEPGAGTFRKSSVETLIQAADGSVPQGAILRFQSTFTAGEATGALLESGVFNVSVKGGAGEKLLAADTFSVVNKGAADTLTWTWEITLQRV